MKNKKQVRNNFREGVLKRDRYTCKVCGYGGVDAAHELDAHHITDRNDIPNGGYVLSNGITLCKWECHLKAEYFHMNKGVEWLEGWHPDDMYKLINSTRTQAFKDSEKL